LNVSIRLLEKAFNFKPNFAQKTLSFDTKNPTDMHLLCDDVYFEEEKTRMYYTYCV